MVFERKNAINKLLIDISKKFQDENMNFILKISDNSITVHNYIGKFKSSKDHYENNLEGELLIRSKRLDDIIERMLKDRVYRINNFTVLQASIIDNILIIE